MKDLVILQISWAIFTVFGNICILNKYAVFLGQIYGFFISICFGILGHNCKQVLAFIERSRHANFVVSTLGFTFVARETETGFGAGTFSRAGA